MAQLFQQASCGLGTLFRLGAHFRAVRCGSPERNLQLLRIARDRVEIGALWRRRDITTASLPAMRGVEQGGIVAHGLADGMDR